jgi:phospholipase C
MILISPYAKPHYISETQYDYGSILRFIEETFNLGSLGTTDATANSLADSFNPKQTPNAFKPAPLPPASSCADTETPPGMVQQIINHDGGVPD